MSDKDTNKSRGPPPTGLPPAEKLPASLQRIIDSADDDSFYDDLYDGTYVIGAQRMVQDADWSLATANAVAGRRILQRVIFDMRRMRLVSEQPSYQPRDMLRTPQI